MLDHVPKRYLKLCARERGEVHFTLMLLQLSCFLESLRAAGGVAERDQGQELRETGSGDKIVEVKRVLKKQQKQWNL